MRISVNLNSASESYAISAIRTILYSLTNDPVFNVLISIVKPCIKLDHKKVMEFQQKMTISMYVINDPAFLNKRQ